MAICWERLSRQRFTVLILNAVLVVLVPLPFGVWGGMWNSLVSAPDHCLFVHFSQLTQAQGCRLLLNLWSGHGPLKAFPECRKQETGRARERDLHRETFRLRKVVDAFLLQLSAISVNKFSQFCRYVGRNISTNCYVGASENTSILNTTISTLTESRYHLEDSYF